MKLEEKILTALRLAIKKADGKSNLAAQRKTAYSIVNRFENGQCKIKNMTISTLEKLFPQIEIIFFPGEKQVSSVIDTPEHFSSLQKALQEAESKKNEYEKKLAELEKERHIFELEKENWKLKRDLEEARDADMKRGMRSPFSRQ